MVQATAQGMGEQGVVHQLQVGGGKAVQPAV